MQANTATKVIRLHPEPLHPAGWWHRPLVSGSVLALLLGYAVWASLQGAQYTAGPYISPFYSPCLAASCVHATFPLVGEWWRFSPALLVFWIPAGLRATCYSYRQVYYRAWFLSPPACAVPDASRGYSGETRFPLVLQNLHRWFFYLTLPLLAFLWWDALGAFRFADGFGVGLGTLVLLANAALLSAYILSCNSCRHACGGHLKSFAGSPVRHRAWKLVSAVNVHHGALAWTSLAGVCATDLYIRLIAAGAIADLRIL